MAVNPMQRKARNSFLLGMIISLVVCGVIIVALLFMLISSKSEENAKTKVCVLTADVKSGEEISGAIVEAQESEFAPTNPILIEDIMPGMIAKTDLTMGTILSENNVTTQEDEVTEDTRIQEYNMITLPTRLEVDDYIDIRLMLPTGHDYIVVSKKKVIECDDTNLTVQLSEDEIMAMSSAIIEAYMMKGANLYATNYVEPGLQPIATPTYTVSDSVGNAIWNNPNVLEEAREALANRTNQSERANIDSILSSYTEEEKAERVQSSIEAQITSAQEKRKEYMDMLNAEEVM